VTAPLVVVAVVTVSGPPPVWSNWMLPLPVVSVVAVTAPARALLMSRLPFVLAALIYIGAVTTFWFNFRNVKVHEESSS
jgi:hypothetical protein